MKHALVAAAVAALSFISTAKADDTVVTAAEASAFVQEQFASYFTDCEAFIDTFASRFKYCDGAPCYSSEATLLDACLQTEGSPSTVHSLTVAPASFPDPQNPNYMEFAAKGKQTVTLVLDPTQPPFPLCFDFVITEKLKKKKNVITSKEWIGYYSISFSTCQ